jgi:transposase
VIGALRGVSVWAYDKPCDMRKKFNTLQALVEGKMKSELATEDLFVFVAENRKRAKGLYFDGTGLCLFSKRLEAGNFATPWRGPMSKRLELTMNELSLFIEGSESLGRIELSPRSEDPRSRSPGAGEDRHPAEASCFRAGARQAGAAGNAAGYRRP